MGTLDYQNNDDARTQQRKGFWLKLFGVSKSAAWEALAHEINARIEHGGWWSSDRVIADVGSWQITLDTYTVSNGKTSTTFTRLRAPYVNRDGFRFRIYRASIFTGLGKMLGMQDIEIGEPGFDQDFVVQSNVPAQVHLMLQDPHLRQLMEVQPRVMFQVKDDDGYFRGRFPDGVDELHFVAMSVIKDVDRLRGLFDLLTATLERLCEIGSAYDQHPGITL